jgi:hypothetical protein
VPEGCSNIDGICQCEKVEEVKPAQNQHLWSQPAVKHDTRASGKLFRGLNHSSLHFKGRSTNSLSSSLPLPACAQVILTAHPRASHCGPGPGLGQLLKAAKIRFPQLSAGNTGDMPKPRQGRRPDSRASGRQMCNKEAEWEQRADKAHDTMTAQQRRRTGHTRGL